MTPKKINEHCATYGHQWETGTNDAFELCTYRYLSGSKKTLVMCGATRRKPGTAVPGVPQQERRAAGPSFDVPPVEALPLWEECSPTKKGSTLS